MLDQVAGPEVAGGEEELFCGPEASGPAETDLLVEMVVAELLARALGLDPEALQEGE